MLLVKLGFRMNLFLEFHSRGPSMLNTFVRSKMTKYLIILQKPLYLFIIMYASIFSLLENFIIYFMKSLKIIFFILFYKNRYSIIKWDICNLILYLHGFTLLYTTANLNEGPIYDDVRYFPTGLFPSGNFPMVFYQVPTFQMCDFPTGNFPNVHFPKWQFPKWQLPHVGNCYLGKCTFGKLLLGKLHIWEVATWEIVTWEVSLGKRPFGKYLTPIWLDDTSIWILSSSMIKHRYKGFECMPLCKWNIKV